MAKRGVDEWSVTKRGDLNVGWMRMVSTRMKIEDQVWACEVQRRLVGS